MRVAIVLSALLVLVSAPVIAQECWMQVLFDVDGELVDQVSVNTGLLDAYLVLSAPIGDISAYEAGIAVSDPSLFILSVSGPNGWTNFGDNLNQLVGYSTPLPIDGPTALCMFAMLMTGGGYVEICVTGTEPSQFGTPAPGYADGDGNWYPCEGRCSQINPAVATQDRSFTEIKALFH
ncbi:MAG: hypothetical protein R3D98_16485 [Candidatus Krumholzibacteriia bacterium]